MHEKNNPKKMIDIIIGTIALGFFSIVGFFAFTDYNGEEPGPSVNSYTLTPDDERVRAACIRPWVYINADNVYSWTNQAVAADYPDENCEPLSTDPSGSDNNYDGCEWENCTPANTDEGKSSIYRIKCTSVCLKVGS